MSRQLPPSFYEPDKYMLWTKADAEQIAQAIEESIDCQNELSREYERIASILDTARADILRAKRGSYDSIVRATKNNTESLKYRSEATTSLHQRKAIIRAEALVTLNELSDEVDYCASSLKESPIWLVYDDIMWSTYSGYEQPQGSKLIRLWINGSDLDNCKHDEIVKCTRHKNTIPIALLLTWCLNKGHDMTLSRTSTSEDNLISFLAERLSQTNDAIYKTLYRMGINNSTFHQQ